MALQQWKKVKPLNNPMAIKQLEEQYNFSLSEDLVSCILANNGGRPKPNTIAFRNGEENDVKILLSYNDSDPENIYKVIDFFSQEYNCSLVPFATDSGGNYYCEQEKRIVFWTQNKEILPVCNSFCQFLNSLYELEQGLLQNDPQQPESQYTTLSSS